MFERERQEVRRTRKKIMRETQDEKEERGGDREVKEMDWDSIQLIAVSLTAM